MSDMPDSAGESALENVDFTGDSPRAQEQEFTLEQLNEHITGAETAHKDLSARLDSIPRD